MKIAIVVATLLLIVVCSAPAEEKVLEARNPDSKIPAVHKAMGEIIDKVLGARSGLRLGMPSGKVAASIPTALQMTGEYFMPLSKSPFAPAGDWDGMVYVFPIDDGEPLDEIRVFFMPGKYDRTWLRKFIQGKLRKYRFGELEKDTEDPFCWSATAEGSQRDIWLGLGEGIVAIDFSQF